MVGRPMRPSTPHLKVTRVQTRVIVRFGQTLRRSLLCVCFCKVAQYSYEVGNWVDRNCTRPHRDVEGGVLASRGPLFVRRRCGEGTSAVAPVRNSGSGHGR